MNRQPDRVRAGGAENRATTKADKSTTVVEAFSKSGTGLHRYGHASAPSTGVGQNPLVHPDWAKRKNTVLVETAKLAKRHDLVIRQRNQAGKIMAEIDKRRLADINTTAVILPGGEVNADTIIQCQRLR